MMESRIQNYKILETLGTGVSATVKLARSEDGQGSLCAIKIFQLDNIKNADFIESQMTKEAEL